MYIYSTDGYLFDKEAILEYYIAKKKEIARNLKEYEKQNKKEENERDELKAAAHRSQVEKFIGKFFKLENSFYSVIHFNVFLFIATEKGETVNSGDKPSTSKNTLSNMAAGKAKELPSFWVPSQTPDAKPVILPKPDTTIYCPSGSGKVLKIKDLIDIKFTEAPNDEPGKSIIRYYEACILLYSCCVCTVHNEHNLLKLFL